MFVQPAPSIQKQEKAIFKEDLINITTSLLLMFVQQKTGFVIISQLFSLYSRPIKKKKKQQGGIWRASTHPCLGREQPSRDSGQQCMGLTCQESHCVENAVERKFKEAKGPESFPENFTIKIKPQSSINLKVEGKSGSWGLLLQKD